MTDTLTKERRSWTMAQIHSKNTKPELIVRKLCFGMGFRYRLQGRVSKKVCPKGFLPGHPDLVFRKLKSVIFVNGCFWHQHSDKNCKASRIPKSNIEFWTKKFERNVERDQRNLKELQNIGWHTLVIWECELKNLNAVKNKIEQFLNSKEIQYLETSNDYLQVAEDSN